MIEIKTLSNSKKEAGDVLIEVFRPFWPQNNSQWFLDQVSYADYSISLGAFDGEKIVGVYYLVKKPDPNGLFVGMGLAILPDYQGRGISKMFFKEIEKYGCDYWWGTSAKILGQEDFWKKYRTIYKQENDAFYSVKFFTDKNSKINNISS